MLTRLRLKNWRSLQDVTIEFDTPITVLIGANSSGKSNILDALSFIREFESGQGRGIVGAVYDRGAGAGIVTQGDLTQPVVIEFTLVHRDQQITRSYHLKFNEQGEFTFNFRRETYLNGQLAWEPEDTTLPGYARLGAYSFVVDDSYRLNRYLQQYFNRWQMLTELYSPATQQPATSIPAVILMPDASNLPVILDYMRTVYPATFAAVERDMTWLLHHVQKVETQRDAEATRIRIREAARPDAVAPSISTGTARILAMVAGYHLLDILTERVAESVVFLPEHLETLSEVPGLIVIDEPDNGLNPGILKRLVEQFREYTDHEYPRQFILTTHNPAFLDHFDPQEVRVLERDAQGLTTVNRIPDHIRDIWLDRFGLGEVWMTRILGGVPE